MSNKKRIEELEATCSALHGSLHRLEHLCRLYREGPQRLTVFDPPVSQDHPSYENYIWNSNNAEKLQALWRVKDEVQAQIEDLNARHTNHLRGYSELASKTGECIDKMAEHTLQTTRLQCEFDELSRVIRENYVKFGPMLGEVQMRLSRLEDIAINPPRDDDPNVVDEVIERVRDLERRVTALASASIEERVKVLQSTMGKLTDATIHPVSEDKLVQKTTDSPRPLIDGDLSKGILSVWKVKLNNTADPSATLYWRRTTGGRLHLCELGPRPGNITAVETEWAHPCCSADDFPDPGRAKKDQPKLYCGDCLERCLRLLCEGYPDET